MMEHHRTGLTPNASKRRPDKCGEGKSLAEKIVNF